MRLSLEWLGEWIELPDESALVDRLDMCGFEDVQIERSGPDLSPIRIGEVVEHARHPNADRLSVCRVDVGEGEPVEVVCGAPNVALGQKVALAPVGTTLPDGTKLKRSRIRGVTSHGMICSSRELGLGDDHEGILVLDPSAPVGAPLSDALPLGRAVLEVGITPNRGDTASLLGVAREVRALFGGELRVPPTEPPEEDPSAEASAAVQIDAPSACHRYVARIVRGLRVEASPEWLVRRLEASGIRAINNVVDVTNLVLLEFGQPLHAFDLARLGGGQVRVRWASPGEKVETLDGELRELCADDLVIADAEEAIALAGVMGGARSEVTDHTRDVLIESAHFHPTAVRLSARRHGIQSEASYRFERGVDREGVARAADRAARLLAEIAGGAVARGSVVARGDPPDVCETVRLSVARANRLLGTSFGVDEAAGLLERVGVGCRIAADEQIEARIPSHRNDLRIPEDLIEEIARIHGYDRIATTLPRAALEPALPPPGWLRAEGCRDALVAAGLVEVLSFPFVPESDSELLRLPEGDPRRTMLRLQNPVREEEPCLRSTLVACLLRVARQNLARQVDGVRLFELSRVFIPAGNSDLPHEPVQVAALLTQPEEPALWRAEPPPPVFFEAKGIAESLLNQLGYVPMTGTGEVPPYLHPGASLAIGVADRVLGAVGELHPEVAARIGIEAPCALLEIDLDLLGRCAPSQRRYREVSRHPQVRRDLAVVVDEARCAGELLAAIRKTAGRDLVSVDVFDRYAGRGVPEGRVSLAFRLVFQRADRTLKDAEVSAAIERVVRMMERRFDGRLR